MVYEPPLVTGSPLGGEALGRARAALASERPGKAMYIFARDIAGMSTAIAWMTRMLVAGIPSFRRRVVHPLDDVEAIDQLGERLDAYRRIDLPAIILEGDRSPARIRERAAAVARALPHARKLVLHRQGHAAHLRDPGRLAAVIEGLADEVLPP